MYARIATFEGAAGIDEAIRQINESDRPEGIPATELYVFVDRAAGKVVALTLFETEEDMQKGHEAFNAMSAADDGLGKRTGVDLLEVVVHMTA